MVLAAISGHYHMWFIPMMVGLYICCPVLKQIVCNRKTAYYYLVVSFVGAFLIPWVVGLVNDFMPGKIQTIVNTANSTLSNANLSFVTGYSFYFLLGYLLSEHVLTEQQKHWVYMIGIAGFISTILLDWIVALKIQQPCGNYYGNFSVNVLAESVAVFVWFKNHPLKNEKITLQISRLAKYSFGAYLVHALVIEQLATRFEINTMMFNAALTVPLITCVTFVLSFTISMVLNHVPILKKYVV